MPDTVAGAGNKQASPRPHGACAPTGPAGEETESAGPQPGTQQISTTKLPHGAEREGTRCHPERSHWAKQIRRTLVLSSLLEWVQRKAIHFQASGMAWPAAHESCSVGPQLPRLWPLGQAVFSLHGPQKCILPVVPAIPGLPQTHSGKFHRQASQPPADALGKGDRVSQTR